MDKFISYSLMIILFFGAAFFIIFITALFISTRKIIQEDEKISKKAKLLGFKK